VIRIVDGSASEWMGVSQAVEEFRDLVDAISSAVESTSDLNDDLRARSDAAEREVAQARRGLEERDRLREEFGACRKDLLGTQREVALLSQEAQKSERRLKEAGRRLATAEAALEAARAEAAKKRAENVGLAERLRAAQERAVEAEGRAEELEVRLENERDRREIAEAEAAGRKVALGKERGAADGLKATIAALEREQETGEKVVEELMAELEGARGRNRELQASRDEAMRALAETERDLSRTAGLLQEQERVARRAEEERDRAKVQLSVQAVELREERERRAEQSRRADGALDRVREVEAQLVRWEQERAAGEVDRVREDGRRDQELAGAREEARRLGEQLGLEKARVATADREVQALTRDLEAEAATRVRLAQELADLKRALAREGDGGAGRGGGGPPGTGQSGASTHAFANPHSLGPGWSRGATPRVESEGDVGRLASSLPPVGNRDYAPGRPGAPQMTASAVQWEIRALKQKLAGMGGGPGFAGRSRLVAGAGEAGGGGRTRGAPGA